MKCHGIGTALHVAIRPEDGVARLTAIAQANLGKFSLSPFELLVKVNEESGDPLSARAQAFLMVRIGRFEIVEVTFELLADRIMQQLRRLEYRHRNMGRGGYACTYHFDHEVHVGNLEVGAPVGSIRIGHVLTVNVQHHRCCEHWPPALDDPAAFRSRCEILDDADAGGI